LGVILSAKWYIINTLSGHEGRVVSLIREAAIQHDIAHQFHELVVPVEKVMEVRKGEKIEVSKKVFPGYILAKMELNDLTWNIVKNTPKVAGFLGGSKPKVVPEREVNDVLESVEEESEAKDMIIPEFEVGEEVLMVEGPFDAFMAVIDDVDMERKKLKVTVSIFGRNTIMELDFNQVEKQK
jgi:transcriptional antiterminator NusG